MTTTPGFEINGNKGFHITFKNGVCVSVQFGGGNYCQNYNVNIPSIEGEHCIDAELAIWDRDGAWLTKKFNPTEDEMMGRAPPYEVLRALIWAEAYDPKMAELNKALILTDSQYYCEKCDQIFEYTYLGQHRCEQCRTAIQDNNIAEVV